MTRPTSLKYLTAMLFLFLLGFFHGAVRSQRIQTVRLPGDAAAVFSNTYDLLLPRYHDCVIVLMYHDIGFRNKESGVIPPQLFDAHMFYVREMGFNPISFEAFSDFLDGKGRVLNNAVLITFDDGYESFYKYAYPVLKRYRFPAMNFVVVKNAQDTDPSNAVRHLSWDQMREMERSGLVAMGSHTYDSHHYVPTDLLGHRRPALVARIYDPSLGRQETEDEYEMRVGYDLWLSRRLLEENLQARVTALAFPYGAYNPTVLRLARDAGYRYLFTIESGVNRLGRNGRNAALVRRLSVGDSCVTVSELNKRITNALSPARLPWGRFRGLRP